MAAKELVVHNIRKYRQPIIAAAIVAAIVAAIALWTDCVRADLGDADMNTKQHTTTEELYLVSVGMRYARTLPDRVKASRRLARRDDAEPWLVLLYVSAQLTPSSDDAGEQTILDGRRQTLLGIITVTQEELPDTVPAPILYAMTFLLDIEERGQWSETTGLIFSTHSEHLGRPMRDIVRNNLAAQLGEDHGFDKSAWQKAIMNRASQTGE